MSIRKVGNLSYDTSRKLGEGKFGTLVFSGFYGDESNNPVAVKRVQIMSYLPDELDTLQREVKLMQKARYHVNILRCIGTAMNEDYL